MKDVPMPDARRVVQVTAIGAAMLFAAVLPASADAQQPTITATGQGEVKPQPRNRKIDVSIRKAVEVAHAAALPLAMADARAKAAEMAAVAGLTLGPLVSIADAPQPGYPFIFSQQNGTFGNGHYCGKVRNFKTVVRNGVRRRVVAKGSHTACRVPPEVYANVSLTFSTVAA
jgi:uncharacterized protein YggE